MLGISSYLQNNKMYDLMTPPGIPSTSSVTKSSSVDVPVLLRCTSRIREVFRYGYVSTKS